MTTPGEKSARPGSWTDNVREPPLQARIVFYSGTIATSSFLLFMVQPLISKQILPWFGGTAAVWTLCMIFFQVALVVGYGYADWVTRRLPPRGQATLHVALLAIGLWFLPIIPSGDWQPAHAEDPSESILVVLAVTIGWPYFLLSTTAPLIQSWVSRTIQDLRVYRMFSLSNLAALAALVSYPFALEPYATTTWQATAWSWIFVLFVLLGTGSAWLFAGQEPRTAPGPAGDAHALAADALPSWSVRLTWLALPALGSWLLLAITHHITQNIASVPFLWLLPLTIYLVTFVLCFESDRWYSRTFFHAPLTLALGGCSWGLLQNQVTLNFYYAIPLYTVGLFVMCMFLHGELARMRPAPRHLSRFYLMVAVGGAAGGSVVGLAAPQLLSGHYELGIGILLTALAARIGLYRGANQIVMPSVASVLVLLCGYAVIVQMVQDREDTVTIQRNFYGVLRTHANHDDRTLVLRHGIIIHGSQYLDPLRRREATTYYTPATGIGLAITHRRTGGKRVGVIGLGAGTLATYGQPGDLYRFYEINPLVIALAREEFTFLGDSQATIQLVPGDARLSLAAEPPQHFDVLAIDAFSGDSVPVHLLTREALGLYLHHLAPDGLIAFHVTNRFLRLGAVVAKNAAEYGLHTVTVSHRSEFSSHWALVAKNPAMPLPQAIVDAASPPSPLEGFRPWSDDFSNLLDLLKW